MSSSVGVEEYMDEYRSGISIEDHWDILSIDINGYKLKKDSNTNWLGSFDWRVLNPKGIKMGWFGSRESAEVWIRKQISK